MRNRNESGLKEKLIQALKKLSKVPAYHDHMMPIIEELQKKENKIPPSDYKNIIIFVYKLADSIENPLKNHPSARELSDFYKYCYNQFHIKPPKPPETPKPEARHGGGR